MLSKSRLFHSFVCATCLFAFCLPAAPSHASTSCGYINAENISCKTSTRTQDKSSKQSAYIPDQPAAPAGNPTIPSAPIQHEYWSTHNGKTLDTHGLPEGSETAGHCVYNGLHGELNLVRTGSVPEEYKGDSVDLPGGFSTICITPEVSSGTAEAIHREETIRQTLSEEFSRMHIEKPVLVMDNAPHTMNTTHTNFYFSNAKIQSTTVEALGESFTIEAHPVNYRYEYGDNLGTRLTNTPGTEQGYRSSYGEDATYTSHQYPQTGNYHAYGSVIYQARYKGNDGTWHIIGTTELHSDPVLVRVWKREYYPVAKTCKEDPHGRGCPGTKDYPDKNNPNPRLMVPDIKTGQRWHQDNEGGGDTEKHLWRGYYTPEYPKTR